MEYDVDSRRYTGMRQLVKVDARPSLELLVPELRGLGRGCVIGEVADNA